MGKTLPTKGGGADSHALEEGATALERMQVTYAEGLFDPWKLAPAGTHYPGTPFGWTLELGVASLTGAAVSLTFLLSGGSGSALVVSGLAALVLLLPLAAALVFGATAARVGAHGAGEPDRVVSGRGLALVVRLFPVALVQVAALTVAVNVLQVLPQSAGAAFQGSLLLAAPVWVPLWLWCWLHLVAAAAAPRRGAREWLRAGGGRALGALLSPSGVLRSSLPVFVQGFLHVLFEGILLLMGSILLGSLGAVAFLALLGDLPLWLGAGLVAAVLALPAQVLLGRLAHVWSLLLLASGGAPGLEEADALPPGAPRRVSGSQG